MSGPVELVLTNVLEADVVAVLFPRRGRFLWTIPKMPSPSVKGSTHHHESLDCSVWQWLSFVLKCWGRGVSEAFLCNMEPRALPASGVLCRRVLGVRTGARLSGSPASGQGYPTVCGSGTRERLARRFWLRLCMCLQSSWPPEGVARLREPLPAWLTHTATGRRPQLPLCGCSTGLLGHPHSMAAGPPE